MNDENYKNVKNYYFDRWKIFQGIINISKLDYLDKSINFYKF